MKYWQRDYEAAAQALTLGNVDVVPPNNLPQSGFLGSLLLRFSGSQKSGQGQGGGAWRILDYISKIEVLLNESTICKSLTASELKAITFLDQGVLPKGRAYNYATATQWDWLLLNFGRRLFDPDLGLDLSKYDSVKLRITNTGSPTTWSDITVAVVGIVQKDTAGPVMSQGYMRTEEWKAWTTVADQYIYSDLPTEYKIRRVLLQALPALDVNNLTSTGMHNLMDNILFSMKTKDITLFNGALQELMRENHLDRGQEVISAGAEYMTAGKGFDVGIGYVSGGAWGAGDEAGTAATTDPTLASMRDDHVQNPITYQADHPINYLFTGVAPEECAWFRFDQLDDPQTWLDPDQMKTVKCDIHTRNSSSAASGTNKIILDRYVPY